jgi:transposase-like protein
MKSDQSTFPETLQQAMVHFADPAKGLEFMVSLRWPSGKVTCPHCQGEKVSFLSTRQKWKCMNAACHKQFSAKVGTIFEDSALGYDKWFPAMWMIVNAKNGISSYEIARALGVTQKTAWFMLHRIRLALKSGTFDKLSGEIEADETYVGGKSVNMHEGKRKASPKQRGTATMVPVAGLLQRSTKDVPSRVKLRALNRTRRSDLFPHILQNVERGAAIFTDAFRSYRGLHHAYTHEMIDHAIAYVNGNVHTNGMENFWSLLKRTIKGTYVSVDPVHLHQYLDEQAFRFNERKDSDSGRFIKAAKGVIGRGLRYLDLIDGKGGEDLTPQTAGAW